MRKDFSFACGLLCIPGSPPRDSCSREHFSRHGPGTGRKRPAPQNNGTGFRTHMIPNDALFQSLPCSTVPPFPMNTYPLQWQQDPRRHPSSPLRNLLPPFPPSLLSASPAGPRNKRDAPHPAPAMRTDVAACLPALSGPADAFLHFLLSIRRGGNLSSGFPRNGGFRIENRLNALFTEPGGATGGYSHPVHGKAVKGPSRACGGKTRPFARTQIKSGNLHERMACFFPELLPGGRHEPASRFRLTITL